MRWCRTNATCRKSSGIRVWVSPTSRTICAVCWNAGWSVAAAKAASFGIVWRTGGSPISSVMQISYLPRQPTELMPAKAIRTNRRDLLQCPIGAPNLKQPSAHPQRMHPLSASLPFDSSWWLRLQRRSAPSMLVQHGTVAQVADPEILQMSLSALR